MFRNIRNIRNIRKIRWRQLAQNEDGISLVEILIAVTIMAIISVTLMGYFTSAMDKSAEESRRIIAANLARLKAAQLRDYFKDESLYSKLALPAKYNENNDPTSTEKLLGSTEINGTTYRYLVELDSSYARWDPADPFRSDSDEYLAKMLVTVYWSDAELIEPPARSSTTLDTYIVKRW